MEFTTQLPNELNRQLAQVISEYLTDRQAASLGEMEQTVRQMAHELSAEVMRQWLERQEGRYPEAEQPCPCGGQARYERRREGMVLTLQGRVYYRRRYYRCPSCGKGHYPLDEQLGIRPGEMSRAVIKLAALVGVQEGYASSSDVLARTALVELSPNSIRKACQQAGQAVLAAEREQIRVSQDLEEQLVHKRQGGPTQLYGSLDGFQVPFRDGWHEMKAGVWWQVDHRQDQARVYNVDYYVDTASASEISDLVWASGFARQADQAEELIFVADGAQWIWDLVQEHFPQAVQIVDWYHACAYLPPVAHLAFPDDPTQRQAWLEQTRTALWEGQLETVIAACQQQVQPHLPARDDPAHKAVTYYTNNRQRMDYPAYREADYQIGSGVMESACKQLGLGRLKIAGARWHTSGARLVAKARATYLSGRWDQLKIA
jgi:hypothetical protein